MVKQAGFTLIELVAVIVITGILSVTVFVRFSGSDFDLQAAKSDVLAALVLARETAMSRTDGSAAVQVVATASGIDVQVNNNSIRSLAQAYPLSFSQGIQISSGTGVLSFNSLGETTAHSITLSQGGTTETITISGVGYAY